MPSLGLLLSQAGARVLGIEEDTVSEAIALRQGTSVPGAHLLLMKSFMEFPMPFPIQILFMAAAIQEQEKEFERRGAAGLDDIARFYPRGAVGVQLRRLDRSLRGVAGITPRGAAPKETIPRARTRFTRLAPRSISLTREGPKQIADLTERGRRSGGIPIAELAFTP